VKLLLLETQVEVDSKTNSGRTPLSWAAANGHLEVSKLLLEAKAKVDSKDLKNRTPLS
jgi:ankyrin repeat protein